MAPRHGKRAPGKKRARRVRAPVEHEVKAELKQPFSLTREGSALEFEILADGGILGTLSIGKGSIGWKGRSDHRVLPLGWSQFVRLMERQRKERKSRRR